MLPIVPVLAAAASLAADAAGEKPSRRLPPGSSRQTVMTRFWDAFERIAGEGQVIFIGPFQLVGDRKGGLLAKLEVSGSAHVIDGNPGVYIGYIAVNAEDRGKGHASRVMRMLVEAADEIGVGMDLEVEPKKERGDKKPAMNVTQLRAFYAKFGFVPVGGARSRYMQRPASRPAGS